jgi:hypothetical protein
MDTHGKKNGATSKSEKKKTIMMNKNSKITNSCQVTPR